MSHLLLERLAAGQPVRHADLQAWAAGALRQIAHGADAAAALRLDRAQRVRHRDRHRDGCGTIHFPVQFDILVGDRCLNFSCNASGIFKAGIIASQNRDISAFG